MVWSGNGTITMDDDGKNMGKEERSIRKNKMAIGNEQVMKVGF